MTRSPGILPSRACAARPVPSVLPSSTTTISCAMPEAAMASASAISTGPMPSASL
jgi:hypothetical protein